MVDYNDHPEEPGEYEIGFAGLGDRTPSPHAEMLRRLPYARYLQTSHWREMHRRVVLRARGRCARCGARGQIDVHHLTYAHVGSESESDLEPLCRTCHAKEHGKDQ